MDRIVFQKISCAVKYVYWGWEVEENGKRCKEI